LSNRSKRALSSISYYTHFPLIFKYTALAPAPRCPAVKTPQESACEPLRSLRRGIAEHVFTAGQRGAGARVSVFSIIILYNLA
jgi:hypothetical protein